MSPDLAQRRGSGDAHGLAEEIAADLDDAQAVDLADARAVGIDQQRALGDHFANLGFDQVVPLDAGFARGAQDARR